MLILEYNDMNDSEFWPLSRKLKAVAHPTRLKILFWLLDNRCNVMGIIRAWRLPQATVSQHLAVLRGAGIIEGRRKGLNVCYRVKDPMIRELVLKIKNKMEVS